MITMLSRALVTFAADRWPPHLRHEVRREWLAELAVLKASNEHLKSLRFAASLAAHPGHRPDATAAPFLPRVWYAVRVLLIGPVLCELLLLLSYGGMSLIPGIAGLQLLPFGADLFEYYDWAMGAQLPMLTVLSLLSAYLAARIGQRWSPDAPGFLLPVLIATVPGFLGAAAILTAGGMDQKLRHLTVFEVYFLGFGAVL